MDPYPVLPFPPDGAPDPAVNIITNPGAAENIDNLNILTAVQGQPPPTSVPPAAVVVTVATVVVVVVVVLAVVVLVVAKNNNFRFKLYLS